MSFPPLRPWLAIALQSGLVAPLFAANQASSENPFIVAPFRSVTAFAAAQKIPLSEIELAPPEAVAGAGDTIIALVSLVEGGTQGRQWLVQLTTVELTAREKELSEKSKAKLTGTVYTSTGTEAQIDAKLHALEARTIGPFFSEASSASSKSFSPEEKHARTLVPGGFLALGIDRYCLGIKKLREVAVQSQGGIASLDWKLAQTPYAPEVIAKNQPRAAALGITPDDERGVIHGAAALMAFFDVVQKTPGLQDILSELLDKSSLAWSLLTHGGKLKPGFKPDLAAIGPVDSSSWSLKTLRTYRCGFFLSLNEKPTLVTEMIVTSPPPPLLNCAGIVGIKVEPTEDKTKRLVIRVLSAHLAPHAPGATSAK